MFKIILSSILLALFSVNAWAQKSIISELEAKGYWAYPIESLRVIDAAPTVANEDRPLMEWAMSEGEAELIISGTFTGDISNCYHCIPLAAIMRDGIMDSEGIAKTQNRGGIAILKDGSIIIGRANGASHSSIQKTFATEKNPVWEYMGGGALLIENGQIVSSQDLFEKQKFDQGGMGINSQQMRQTNHMVLAQKGKDRFVIVAKNKTGKMIQDDLFKAKFEQVLKFDGGSGIIVRDMKRPERKITGANSTGFAVVVQKEE